MDTSETFTGRARRVLSLAQLEAYRYRTDYVGTQHLLLGLTHDAQDGVTSMLDSLGLPAGALRRHLEAMVGPPEHPRPFHLPYSSTVKRVVDHARRAAQRFGHTLVDAEHILYGMTFETKSVAAELFRALDVDALTLRRALMRRWERLE